MVSLGLNTGSSTIQYLIHDPDAGIEYPISNLADNIKLVGAADFLEE